MVRLILEPLALAVVLALGVRTTVRVYAIPSASMQPTLDVGDQIAVTPYRGGAMPQRGDVVVFRSPADPSELVVKRVIATPGELIDTHHGRVTIGGHALSEPYLAGPASTGTISPQIVPSGCYFVMGDNRTASLDSRSWAFFQTDPSSVGRDWCSGRRPARLRCSQPQPRQAPLTAPKGQIPLAFVSFCRSADQR